MGVGSGVGVLVVLRETLSARGAAATCVSPLLCGLCCSIRAPAVGVPGLCVRTLKLGDALQFSARSVE